MFKVGDEVQLKSGGPVMTVTNAGTGSLQCTWFKNDEVKRDAFPAEALEAYEAPSFSDDEY